MAIQNQKLLIHKEPSDASSEVPTASDIEVWLVSHISELLEIEPKEIDVHKPFTYYGLSSIEGVLLAADLEEWLGHSLDATLVWDYPTIEVLVRYLSEQLTLASIILSSPPSFDLSDNMEEITL